MKLVTSHTLTTADGTPIEEGSHLYRPGTGYLGTFGGIIDGPLGETPGPIFVIRDSGGEDHIPIPGLDIGSLEVGPPPGDPGGGKEATENREPQEAAGQRAPDDCFGGCPVCGSHDGYRNIKREHWFYCAAHRVRWCSGSNIFSGWRGEAQEDWDRNAKMLGQYTEVEPIFPKQPDTGPSIDQWAALADISEALDGDPSKEKRCLDLALLAFQGHLPIHLRSTEEAAVCKLLSALIGNRQVGEDDIIPF